MFSFLDMLNHGLSYFNINTKLKNRIYLVAAVLGEFYLIYVTFRLFVNKVWLRAFLYCLAVILIAVFLYFNILYYFFGKNSKFDILSPKLSRFTGLGMEKEEEERRREPVASARSNGVFRDDDLIPADVKIDEIEQRNLQEVVNQLLDDQMLKADYDGLSEREIIDRYHETGKPVQALNTHAVPPYFELVHDAPRHQLEIFIGLNQMQRKPVGHISRVGLTDARAAHHEYRFYLAILNITGGPSKIAGRSGMTIETDQPYGINAEVAYEGRDNRHPSSRPNPTISGREEGAMPRRREDRY